MTTDMKEHPIFPRLPFLSLLIDSLFYVYVTVLIFSNLLQIRALLNPLGRILSCGSQTWCHLCQILTVRGSLAFRGVICMNNGHNKTSGNLLRGGALCLLFQKPVAHAFPFLMKGQNRPLSVHFSATEEKQQHNFKGFYRATLFNKTRLVYIDFSL